MTRMARGAAAAAVSLLLALALGACHHTSSTLAVAPAAPTGVVATAGDTQVTLSWGPVKGATSYNLYWSLSPGLTPASGAKIPGVTSPYMHTGLTDGTTYYYVVTALNAAGESGASIQVSATPQAGLAPPPPPPPPAWTWTAGSKLVSAQGTYSALGSPGTPGAREVAVHFSQGGHMWLFGGDGYDGSGLLDEMNDLWEYDPSTNQWTWRWGSNAGGAAGNYGSKGLAASTNVIGGRAAAVSWLGAGGNLWVFGGWGYYQGGGPDYLNDLWMYNFSTGWWTYMGGGTGGAAWGVYGSQGVLATNNIPGARDIAASWTGPNGFLWLFGGWAYDINGYTDDLNDLWKYDPSTNQWAWMTGASSYTADSPGVYGSLGVAASGNVPGGRERAMTWVGGSGDLWLFGGLGYDSSISFDDLNDLWKYNPATNQWTWVNGSEFAGPYGVYGTQGVESASNEPGGREGGAVWMGPHGMVWLFGGQGYDVSGSYGQLNDLWRYNPSTNQWAWIAGSQYISQQGTYGTMGTPDPANMPGGRDLPAYWVGNGGNLWLFGGWGYDSGGAIDDLNDMWRYGPLP